MNELELSPCPFCGNWTYDGWTSLESEYRPTIPEGKFGVPVLITTFDEVYEEINPGNGAEVQQAIYDGENFKILCIGGKSNDYLLCSEKITHWMYVPCPARRGE